MSKFGVCVLSICNFNRFEKACSGIMFFGDQIMQTYCGDNCSRFSRRLGEIKISYAFAKMCQFVYTVTG